MGAVARSMAGGVSHRASWTTVGAKLQGAVPGEHAGFLRVASEDSQVAMSSVSGTADVEDLVEAGMERCIEARHSSETCH